MASSDIEYGILPEVLPSASPRSAPNTIPDAQWFAIQDQIASTVFDTVDPDGADFYSRALSLTVQDLLWNSSYEETPWGLCTEDYALEVASVLAYCSAAVQCVAFSDALQVANSRIAIPPMDFVPPPGTTLTASPVVHEIDLDDGPIAEYEETDEETGEVTTYTMIQGTAVTLFIDSLYSTLSGIKEEVIEEINDEEDDTLILSDMLGEDPGVMGQQIDMASLCNMLAIPGVAEEDIDMAESIINAVNAEAAQRFYTGVIEDISNVVKYWFLYNLQESSAIVTEYVALRVAKEMCKYVESEEGEENGDELLLLRTLTRVGTSYYRDPMDISITGTVLTLYDGTVLPLYTSLETEDDITSAIANMDLPEEIIEYVVTGWGAVPDE